MSEPVANPKRRRGRGIDAIFDSTDLDLGSAPQARRFVQTGPRTADPPGPSEGSEGAFGPEDRPGTSGGGGEATSPADTAHAETPPRQTPQAFARPEPRRAPGRPPSNRPPGRELVQRGFYIEVEQDRMLDGTKAALKRRGFTPDRSAIVRAALAHFARLDGVDQAELVRREK